MSFIKIMPGNFSNPDALDFLINRLASSEKCEYWLGQGVSNDNLSFAITDMKRVKKACHKEDGKQLLHIMINLKISSENDYSFSRKPDSQNLKETRRPGFIIAAEITTILYQIGFQSVCFIHHETDCRNLHFVINSVNFVNGKKINESNKLAYKMLHYLCHYYPSLHWQREVYYA